MIKFLTCAAMFTLVAASVHAQSPEEIQKYQQQENFQSNPYYKIDNPCLGWEVETEDRNPYVIFTHFDARTHTYDDRYLCGLDQNKQRVCLKGDPESRQFNKGPANCDESCPPPIWKRAACMPITPQMKQMMYPPEELESQGVTQDGAQQW